MSELAKAFAIAQGLFAPILKDKKVKVQTRTGGSYEFAYAPLEAILGAVRKPLADNGLSLSQTIEADSGHDSILTTLLHASGESRSSRVPIFVAADGAQAYGSGITYARRYGITLLLCVVADEDDDGNAAEGNTTKRVKREQTETPDTPAPAQNTPDISEDVPERTIVQQIRDLAADMGFDLPDLKDWATAIHGKPFKDLDEALRKTMLEDLRQKDAAYSAIAGYMDAKHGNVPDGLTEERKRDYAWAYIKEKSGGKPLRQPAKVWQEWVREISDDVMGRTNDA